MKLANQTGLMIPKPLMMAEAVQKTPMMGQAIRKTPTDKALSSDDGPRRILLGSVCKP
jgi:hypothetical protein